jgi:hypothetical protein
MPATAKSNKALLFIFITLLIDVIGLGRNAADALKTEVSNKLFSALFSPLAAFLGRQAVDFRF